MPEIAGIGSHQAGASSLTRAEEKTRAGGEGPTLVPAGPNTAGVIGQLLNAVVPSRGKGHCEPVAGKPLTAMQQHSAPSKNQVAQLVRIRAQSEFGRQLHWIDLEQLENQFFESLESRPPPPASSLAEIHSLVSDFYKTQASPGQAEGTLQRLRADAPSRPTARPRAVYGTEGKYMRQLAFVSLADRAINNGRGLLYGIKDSQRFATLANIVQNEISLFLQERTPPGARLELENTAFERLLALSIRHVESATGLEWDDKRAESLKACVHSVVLDNQDILNGSDTSYRWLSSTVDFAAADGKAAGHASSIRSMPATEVPLLDQSSQAPAVDDKGPRSALTEGLRAKALSPRARVEAMVRKVAPTVGLTADPAKVAERLERLCMDHDDYSESFIKIALEIYDFKHDESVSTSRSSQSSSDRSSGADSTSVDS